MLVKPKNLIEDIFSFLLLTIAFTLPFGVLLNSWLILLLSALTLPYAYIYPQRFLKNKWSILFYIGFYLIHFYGFLNSDNDQLVVKDLERKLSLLVFPLILGIGPPISRNLYSTILIAFIVPVLGVCLYTLKDGVTFAWDSYDIYENLLVHRPYLGMYCTASIFFLLDMFSFWESWLIKIIQIFLILFFAFFLWIILARMALITLFVVALMYVLVRLYFKKRYKLLASLIILIVFSCFYIYFKSERVQTVTHKILTFSNFNWDEYDARVANNINLRFIKWDCAYRVLKENTAWIKGIGTGDAQEALNECYEKKLGSESFFITNNYNPHNQYISYLINLGVLGLTYFLLVLIISLYRAIKLKDVIGISFLSIIFLLCLTESILTVQKGVVFFSFFNSIFLFKNDKRCTFGS